MRSFLPPLYLLTRGCYAWLRWGFRCPGSRDPNYPGSPDTGVAGRSPPGSTKAEGEPGRHAGLA
jgi:hypothetical protein